jgi:hypothetical protein
MNGKQQVSFPVLSLLFEKALTHHCLYRTDDQLRRQQAFAALRSPGIALLSVPHQVWIGELEGE